MSAKIVKLDVQNIMRIKAASITPAGNIVIIGGKNAQGKTSILDAISMAIGGRKLCPDLPIREGKDEASVSLTLGDLEVTRTFQRDGDSFTSKLSVKNAKGQPLTPPQATLDALIGKLAFDPLEFARMRPIDARETLRALVGLDVEQLEDELGRVFRERTDAGVAKRAAQAVVDELPVPPEPAELISTAEITAKLQRGAERAGELEGLKSTRRERQSDLASLRNSRDEAIKTRDKLMLRIDNLILEIEEAEGAMELAGMAVENFELLDIQQMRADLDRAIESNRKVIGIGAERERYQEKVVQAEEAAVKWKGLDTQHNTIFHDIKRRTEAVEYPIEDLELRKEGVYYQGVPFEQGSRAERIKVSMAIGVAMNKGLGILLIRDGSVLDEDSMAMLAYLAERHDMQFWIEMARGYEGAAGAVIIEDGGVAT